MNKLKVSILGTGQMGSVFVDALADFADLFVYDIDSAKIENLKTKYNITPILNLSELEATNIIILALPKSCIIDFFKYSYGKISPDTICVNLCSFITLRDIRKYIEECNTIVSPNIVSCKLIGHFKKMATDIPTQFIVDHNCQDNHNLSELLALLSNLGNITLDQERKYMDLNLIVAAKAMKSILEMEKTLSEMNYSESIIKSALKNVFIGTADQYPYEEIDYFLEKVCENYSDIPKLLKRSV